MKTVAEFVDEHEEASPRLPLMLCRDSACLREIIRSGKLTCSPCPVFKGEDLIYFFYGVPSYKPNEGEPTETHPAFNPVIFVFHPNTIKKINRIFPFDSGAFEKGRYDKALYKRQKRDGNRPGMKIDDFALTPNYKTPAKAIAAFFGGDNKAYINGQSGVIDETKIGTLDFELHSLSYLYGEKGRLKHDDRSNKIELQINSDLTLDASSIAAIACPAAYGDDPDIQESIYNKWEAEFLPYSFPTGTPLQKMERARLVVEEYLEKMLP